MVSSASCWFISNTLSTNESSKIPGRYPGDQRLIPGIWLFSGAIRGETYTLPLQVELLHQDYNTVGAFTAAGVLAVMAIITLILKSALQWHLNRQQSESGVH